MHSVVKLIRCFERRFHAQRLPHAIGYGHVGYTASFFSADWVSACEDPMRRSNSYVKGTSKVAEGDDPFSTGSSSIDSDASREQAGEDQDGVRWKDELFVALKRGDIPRVRRGLLYHGNPINDPLFATGSPSTGLTVRGAATTLHVAAWAGQAAMCKWLLRHGADVHARDGLHMTPSETATSASVLRVLSRASKYRRHFRKASADVTMDQRIDVLEVHVRRLLLGERAAGTRCHAPACVQH